MQSMYLLIPLSLLLFLVGIWAIYYAVKSHQFDDLDSAAQRIILDDRQERREQLSTASSATPSANPSANPTHTPPPHSVSDPSVGQASDSSV